ncbi:pseudaminic acid biosynthesis-associated methylase [Kumtagia ephedrae]|uniref:Pseudaminic acid biosynthesis-associated methylase n=1 Tax=Kumtagia ephedrae TaxID=2116701 RepID=A0A2P7RNG0_9HYPH|nr:pseudaminic acid biosynthesis-associated methylase [Mesorhizobium ephedrae]PSJ51749.1 pseudaminic acid biosynthesis-associated methylase [Mesorhizobium ephedrae]
MTQFATEQEQFWAGEFGDEYVNRNRYDISATLAMFSRILSKAYDVSSIFELGCNIGQNLRALKLLKPGSTISGVEINKTAHANAVKDFPGVINGSILEIDPASVGDVDLVFTKGVLIHINPERLPEVYDKMAAIGRKYVLISEYYNPVPVTIDYRGHDQRLFKRDFAGEFMDRHPNFRLADYGFVYRRDPVFPRDDATWFLMERK